MVWGDDPDDAESIRAIQASLDGGVNLIDTAPGYGFGRAEEVVGRAIKGRRDKVVLATKCGLIWDDDRGSEWAVFNGRALRRSLRPDTIREELEASLKRMGTDYVDLLQVHWPAIEPEKTPIAETAGCFMSLKDEGKIRAIGVSNLTLDELEEYAGCCDLASDQFRHSMLCRDAEADILPFCREHGLGTLTYMSLEQGLLAGKVGTDRKFGADEWRSNTDWNPWFKQENRPRILDLLAGWRDLTEKYDCTPAQLTIAWTAQQPGVTHVLLGARRVEQATENAAAGDLEIDPKDLERIRQEVEALGEPA